MINEQSENPSIEQSNHRSVDITIVAVDNGFLIQDSGNSVTDPFRRIIKTYIAQDLNTVMTIIRGIASEKVV